MQSIRRSRSASSWKTDTSRSMARSTARWIKTLLGSAPTSCPACSASTISWWSRSRNAPTPHHYHSEPGQKPGEEPAFLALLPRRVLKRQLLVTRILDFDNHRNLSRIAERKRLARVFLRVTVERFEIRFRTPLHDAPANLQLLVRIFEIDNRYRNPRIVLRIFGLQRRLSRTDDDAVAFAANPHGRCVGRAIGHERGKVSKVGTIDELLCFGGKGGHVYLLMADGVNGQIRFLIIRDQKGHSKIGLHISRRQVRIPILGLLRE